MSAAARARWTQRSWRSPGLGVVEPSDDLARRAQLRVHAPRSLTAARPGPRRHTTKHQLDHAEHAPPTRHARHPRRPRARRTPGTRPIATARTSPPIDAADKRPPFKKIANSIRAAILTGEFEPGEQLPPGRELAEFFGVAPMTIQQAVACSATKASSRAAPAAASSSASSLPRPSPIPRAPALREPATSCTRWASSKRAAAAPDGSSPASPTREPSPSTPFASRSSALP